MASQGNERRTSRLSTAQAARQRACVEVTMDDTSGGSGDLPRCAVPQVGGGRKPTAGPVSDRLHADIMATLQSHESSFERCLWRWEFLQTRLETLLQGRGRQDAGPRVGEADFCESLTKNGSFNGGRHGAGSQRNGAAVATIDSRVETHVIEIDSKVDPHDYDVVPQSSMTVKFDEAADDFEAWVQRQNTQFYENSTKTAIAEPKHTGYSGEGSVQSGRSGDLRTPRSNSSPERSQGCSGRYMEETKSTVSRRSPSMQRRAIEEAKKKFNHRNSTRGDLLEMIEEEKTRVQTAEWAGPARRATVSRRRITSCCSSFQVAKTWKKTRDVYQEKGLSSAVRMWMRLQIRSPLFDTICGMVIMVNTVLIGVETDHVAEHGSTSYELWMSQFVLNVWYISELFVRIVAEGPNVFFMGRDYRWNWFDFSIVTTSILDMLSEAMSLGGLAAGRAVRAIRLLRIVRVLRVVRMLRYVREFRKMVFSLASSVQTLFWSLLLLFFMNFCFAVFFTQNAADSLHKEANVQLKADFGSLGSSIYTLYQAISGGKNWGVVGEVLKTQGPVILIFFITYISVTIFGVMNVVTSVFVESAMQSSQFYRDLMVQEKMLAEATSIRHMKEIFKAIDTDNSGSISLEEMNMFLGDDELQLQSYFEALDLNASDTATLFRLLDRDGSGQVDIDEFCDGCMRLKGSARSFDINCISYEMKRNSERLLKFISFVTPRLKKMANDAAFESAEDIVKQKESRLVRIEQAVTTDLPAQLRQVRSHTAYSASLLSSRKAPNSLDAEAANGRVSGWADSESHTPGSVSASPRLSQGAGSSFFARQPTEVPQEPVGGLMREGSRPHAQWSLA